MGNQLVTTIGVADANLRYTTLTSSEQYLAVTLPNADNYYELTVEFFAVKGSDFVQIRRLVVAQRSGGAWTVLGNIALQSIPATSGALSWGISLGAVVADILPITVNSAAGVTWTAALAARAVG